MMKTLLFTLLFVLFETSYSFAKEYPDLIAILDAQKGKTVIDIPTGTYILNLKKPQRGAYEFKNLENVKIKGNNSRIICNRQSQAFFFYNCKNTVFENLAIEYDPPCSTQGTITSVIENTVEIQIHDNYPSELVTNEYHIDPGRVQIYDKDTRELIENFTTTSMKDVSYNDINNQLTGSGIEKTGDHTFRVTLADNGPYKTGDYIVFGIVANGWAAAHTIVTEACDHMKFENITVYDSNCFSFLEYDCNCTHYYRCKVTRKLNDPLYGDRIRAGIADALHSKFAVIGPRIEKCILEHSGDDCIAINGNFYPIYKVDEANRSIYILTSANSLDGVKVKTNDKIVCVKNEGTIRGRATASELEWITPLPTQAEINACFGKLTSVIDSENFKYGVRIKLDNWPSGLDSGDIFYSNDRIGSGYQIIKNKVGHNRSRAILIKSSDGIIEGNEIVHSAMSAIALAPEFYWMEAGCSSNVIIKNNTIRNCMYDSNMDWTSQAGALVVVCQAPNGNLAGNGTFENIDIYKNTITECPNPCIVLNAIKKVYYDMESNHVTPDLSRPRTHGKNYGIQDAPSWNGVVQINCTGSKIPTVEQETGIKNKLIDNSHDYISIDHTGKLSIKNLQPGESALVSIFDISGKLIMNSKITETSTLSLLSLPKGLYIINIQINDIIFSRKIVL